MTADDAARTPYEILGAQGIRDLASAFYDAMDALPEAARFRGMHATDLRPMKSLLAAYLTQWMGGPPVYLAVKGTMCLTDAHAPYAIGPAERDAWLLCMDHALERIGASEELKALLREPLRRVAITQFRGKSHPPNNCVSPTFITFNDS